LGIAPSCSLTLSVKRESIPLKPCVYYLVRYVPNPTSPAYAHIGLFLYCPQARFLDCLFTNQFDGVLRLHPQADLEFLGELQAHFEQAIGENERHFPEYIDQVGSYSNAVQLSEPVQTVGEDLESKLLELFTSHVGAKGAVSRSPDTRMRIKWRLRYALEREGLIGHPTLLEDVPAAQWTPAEDYFTFDFARTADHPTRELKFIHALSLARDYPLAEILTSRFEAVLRVRPAQLIVAHEDIRDESGPLVRPAQDVLRDSHILLLEAARFEELARGIKVELAS
jgi:hypothetical protein